LVKENVKMNLHLNDRVDEWT